MKLLLVIALGLTALVFALVPGAWSPLGPLVDDWIPALEHQQVLVAVHLVGFAGLVVAVSWAGVRLLPSALGVLLFSAILELAQGATPWREASWGDFGVNLIAVLIGTLLAALLFRRRKTSLTGRPLQ